MGNVTVSLREVTDDDIELVMAWRSNPLVYQGFYTQKEPLTWEEHYHWWKTRHNWKRWIIVLTEKGINRDVGCVSISRIDTDNPNIGMHIGEVSLWGKSVGWQALSLALDWLQERGYNKTHTTIRKDNRRAIRLFESVGFKRIGEGREGEWMYEIHFWNEG